MTKTVRKNLAKLKKAAEESKQTFIGAIRALASAIDDKDLYTRGHSERVTHFSVEIAKILKLPEEEIENVKLGALMHDIGKLDIDDQILKKPTTLTNAEFEIMKTHTTRGYEMLKHIPRMEDVARVLHSHHEQLDGTGYPQGLKGDEIPMISRIIMVADCFDAMTTARPYQDPAPIDYVLGVIRSSAPQKYDERVVEALIHGVKTGRIVPRHRSDN